MNSFNSICNQLYSNFTASSPTPINIVILLLEDTNVVISFNLSYIQSGLTYVTNITPFTNITTSGTPSYFTISGLSPNTNYSITLQSQLGDKLSNISSTLSFKTLTSVTYNATGNYSTNTYINTNSIPYTKYTIITYSPTTGTFRFTNKTEKVGYIVVGGGAGGSYAYPYNGTNTPYVGNSNHSAGAGGSGGGISYSPYSKSNLTFNVGTTYNIGVGSGGQGSTSKGLSTEADPGVGYGGDSYLHTVYAYGGVSLSWGPFKSEKGLTGGLVSGGYRAYSYTATDAGNGSSNYFNTGIGYNGLYNGRGGNGGVASINSHPGGNGYLAVDLSNLSISTVNNKYIFGGYNHYGNNKLSAITLSNTSLYPHNTSLYYVCVRSTDISNNFGLKYNDIFTDISINISNFCAGGGGGPSNSSFSSTIIGTTLTYGAGGGGNGGILSSLNGGNATLYGCGGGGGYNNHSSTSYGNGGNGYQGCVILYFPTYW